MYSLQRRRTRVAPDIGDVLGGDDDEGVSVTINLRMPGGPAPPSLKLQQLNAAAARIAARKRMEHLTLGVPV